MTFSYNAKNWYWTPPAGQNTGMVYSSAAGALVSITNSAYVAWLTAGNVPQLCPLNTSGVQDWPSLDWVLTGAGIPVTGLTPPTLVQLLSYTNGKIAALLAIPRLYGPLGAGGPTVKCDGTTATGVSLAAINAWGTAAPTATQPWLDDYGVATTITGAQGVTLSALAGTYARSVWAVAASTCTAILAGTVTTTAQIDALAWPT